MATRRIDPQLEEALLRQVRRLVPVVVEEAELRPLVARALLDKAPRLARVAVQHMARRGEATMRPDQQIQRALVAHARMMQALAMRRSFPPALMRSVLLSWRPYCDEAPDLFPPFCRVRT